MEHLGLITDPLNPAEPIVGRHGWDKVAHIIRLLGRLPGTALVRERLAMAHVRPQFQWASPLLAPPPEHLARDLAKAVWRTGCTWWCRSRWYADRIALHPRFGTATQALLHARRVADDSSEHLLAALKAHCAVLGLNLHSLGRRVRDTVVTLSSRAQDDLFRQIKDTLCTIRMSNLTISLPAALPLLPRVGSTCYACLPVGTSSCKYLTLAETAMATTVLTSPSSLCPSG